MAQWFVVVRKDTGEAVSYGSVVADAAELERRGLEAIALGEAAPDLAAHRWDPATRRHVARATVDRVDEVVKDSRLAPLLRGQTPILEALRAVLADVLGSRRYRVDDEPVGL